MPDTTINPNRALWEKGDFTRLAATMRDSGDALIATLYVGPGMDVLGLGCGDGTTALPSARRGARVLGVDIAANLVAAGIRRGREAGLVTPHFQPVIASSPDDTSDTIVRPSCLERGWKYG